MTKGGLMNGRQEGQGWRREDVRRGETGRRDTTVKTGEEPPPRNPGRL